jgi:Ca-activated chloride channel family protein
MDRVVVGLDQRNFELYEGKQPQKIKHFFSEDGPVSVGVILDMSGSMKTTIERARKAVEEFLKAANPQDEFFLITFADRPHVVQDFTQKAEDIQAGLLYTTPKGPTALLDAIYMGVDKMKEAKYQRRALLLIWDGGDNYSRYTDNEVKALTKEAAVLIYSVGIFDRDFASREELLGPALLTEISEVTGARCYTLDDSKYLPVVTRHIGVQLRNQYVLAYRPNNTKDDGKWREMKSS